MTGQEPWLETQGGRFKFNARSNLGATQWDWVIALENELSIAGHIELETARAPGRGGTDGIPQPPKVLSTGRWKLLGGWTHTAR